MNVGPIPLVMLIAVLVGCSGDEEASPTSTAEAPTTIESPTTVAETTLTTSVATTTTSSTTSEPAASSTTNAPTTSAAVVTSTVPSDVDWRQVVEDLGRTRQAIYENPDVARISEACIEGSPCADQLRVQIVDLASKGWRVIDADPYSVLSAEVEAFDGGDSPETALVVTLIVVVERPEEAGRIIDADGATVAAVEAETEEGVNTENRTVLSRAGSSDGPWRIVSQERLREVDG